MTENKTPDYRSQFIAILQHLKKTDNKRFSLINKFLKTKGSWADRAIYINFIELTEESEALLANFLSLFDRVMAEVEAQQDRANNSSDNLIAAYQIIKSQLDSIAAIRKSEVQLIDKLMGKTLATKIFVSSLFRSIGERVLMSRFRREINLVRTVLVSAQLNRDKIEEIEKSFKRQAKRNKLLKGANIAGIIIPGGTLLNVLSWAIYSWLQSQDKDTRAVQEMVEKKWAYNSKT